MDLATASPDARVPLLQVSASLREPETGGRELEALLGPGRRRRSITPASRVSPVRGSSDVAR
jgi:hypothetical protein